MTARRTPSIWRRAISRAAADAIRLAEAQLLSRQLEIQALKLQIAQLKRLQYGRSSEQLNEKIGQLELTLEDLEAAEGAVPVASTTPIANMARLPRAPSYTN